MAEKNTSTLLILNFNWSSGRMEQWSEAALFLAGGSRGPGANLSVATSSFFFFSFYRIFTLLLFPVYSHC